MIFNTFQFIWLFPLVFIFYWASIKFNGKKTKLFSKTFLLIVSYAVYIQWNISFGLIMLYITLCSYFFPLLISAYQNNRINKSSDVATLESHNIMGGGKYLAISGVTLTVFPLVIYKYTNFVIHSGASALQWIGIDQVAPQFDWAVPLGLSFYSFQAIGYICDVYSRKINPEKNILNYALFISFFPQIICGPISSAKDLLPQIRNPRSFNYEFAIRGLRFLLWGMFLKVVLADRLGMYVDYVYAHYEMYSGTTALLSAIFYSLQIYGDFAGYSYMAIGVAYLLGVELILNFRRPYLTTSVSAFWKRWNISLTRWLTTYIFIPLGGSRCSKIRNYSNILTTFLVSGIWHGANWTFIFWGCLHGIAQCVEKFLGINKTDSMGIIKFVRIVATFIFVTLAWVYFRSPSIEFANDYIAHIFTIGEPFYFHINTLVHIALALMIVIPIEIMCEFYPSLFSRLFKITALRWCAYILLTLMIVALGVLDASQFIYVQF